MKNTPNIIKTKNSIKESIGSLSNKEIFYLIILGVIFSAVCIFGFGLEFSDQNVYYYMGKLIANGQMPYQDFFFSHPPGELYIDALIYKVFGASLLAFKIASLIAVLLSAILVYIIAREQFSIKTAMLSYAIFLCTYETIRIASGNLGMAYTVMLSVLAIYFLIKDKIFLSGLVFGLALLFTLHAAPLFLASCIYCFASLKDSKLKLHFKKSATLVLGFLASFGIVTLVFVLLTSMAGTGQGYISQVFLYHLNKPSSSLPSMKFSLFIQMLKYNVLIFLPVLLILLKNKPNPKEHKKNAGKFYNIGKSQYSITLIILMAIIYSVYLILLSRVFPYYYFGLFPYLALLCAIGIVRVIDNYQLQSSKLFHLLLGLALAANLAFAANQYYWTIDNSYKFELIKSIGFEIPKNEIIFGDYMFAPLIAFNEVTFGKHEIAGNIIDTNPLVFQTNVISQEKIVKTLKEIGKVYIIIRQGNSFMLQSEVSKDYLNTNCEFIKSWDFSFPSYFQKQLVNDKVFLIECQNEV